MSRHAFEIRPVAHYSGARYPGVAPRRPPVDDDADGCTPGPVRLAFTAALILLISLGLVACYGDLRGKLNDRFEVITGADAGGGGDGGSGDDGGDITMGVMAECTPGEVRCDDADTLVTCDDSYTAQRQSCAQLCEDRFAASGELGYSLGCDAGAADPCQCQHDMIDGGMPACYPGDVVCEDDNVVMTCDESYTPSRQDCDQVCAEQGQISLGCDAVAQDPCQCQYDIVMGEMAMCTPGDVLCFDEATAGVCNDGVDYDRVPCEEHCQSTHGADYTSIGCDAQDPNNFCGCKPRIE